LESGLVKVYGYGLAIHFYVGGTSMRSVGGVSMGQILGVFDKFQEV